MKRFWAKTKEFFNFLLLIVKGVLSRLEGRKQITIVWLLILLSTTSFIGYALSITVAKLEFMNAISVFNLGDTDLIYQYGDTVLNIPTFDSYNLITKEQKNFSISKSDKTEESKNFVLDKNKSKLYIYVASEDNRYCFVNADVTSLYYDNGDDTNAPQGITVLTTNPSPVFETYIDWNKYEYVYPGRYYPNEIDFNSSGKRLIGFYPIECKSITDSKAISDIITFYKTFRAEVERDLLHKELEKLQ